MTDDEYIAFLKALAVKHLSKNVQRDGIKLRERNMWLSHELETVSRLVRLFKVIVDRPEDYSLVVKFFDELAAEPSPVDRTVRALQDSNLAEALDDAGEVVLGELRRMSIPHDDVSFLRRAGFTDDEVEVFLSVAIAQAHRLAVSANNRAQTPRLSEDFKALASRFPEPKELAQSPKKRKLLNGIGKILGGSVAGIGNALMATGTISAPNPATAYGAIASAGIAVSGIFAGIGDLRGE